MDDFKDKDDIIDNSLDERHDYVKLLNDIKNKIPKIEASMKNNKPADDQLLKEVAEEYMEIVIFMKNYLINKQDMFVAAFFKSLDLRIDFQLPATCAVRVKPPAMLFNPLLIEDYSLKNIATDIMHNVYHIAFNHVSEAMKLAGGNKDDIKKLNIAMDAEVNDIIHHESRSKHITKAGKEKLELHPDWIKSSTVEKLSGITVREKDTNVYYNKVLDSRIKDISKQMKQAGMCAVPGVLPGGSGNGDGDGEGQFKSAKFGDNIRTKDNLGDGADQHVYANAGKSGEELDQDSRQLVCDVFNNMSVKDRGTMAGSLMQQIQMMMEPPKLDWKKIFRRYVGSVPEGKRRSPFRLSRMMPTNPNVRGKLNDKVIDVLIAIDTSGSVSDQEIQWAFNEIGGMLKGRKHSITVIECDWEIQRVYDLQDMKKATGVAGRGGTQFAPVIKYVNDRDYRDQVNRKVGYTGRRDPKECLLIYFTDGGGEGTIDRPNCYRTMWVLTQPLSSMSVEDTHGAPVVSLLDDTTFKRKFR